MIQQTRLIGTDIVIFSVWEPAQDDSHSMITHDDKGNLIGQVGTRRRPQAIDQMRGIERFDAVHAHYQAQYNEAYAAIIAAHPEAEGGYRQDGEIELYQPL